MKTAMKRLLSLVLVAMMLVSVVPFQASAAENITSIVLNVAAGQPIEATIKWAIEGQDNLGSREDFEVVSTEIKDVGADESTYTEFQDDGDGIFSTEKNVDVKFEFKAKEPDPVAYDIQVKVVDEKGNLITTITHQSDLTEEQAQAYINATSANYTILMNQWDDDNIGTEVGKYTLNSTTLAKVEGDKVIFTANVTQNKAPEATDPAPTDPAPTDPAPEDNTVTVTFIFCDNANDNCDENVKCDSGVKTYTITKGGKLNSTPNVTDRYGYTFDYWYNVTDNSTKMRTTYDSDCTYKAVYEEDANSNLHKVKIYGVTYNDGRTNTISTPLVVTYVQDKADLLTALQNQAGTIKSELNAADSAYSEAHGFQWDGVTFYDEYGLDDDDKVTSGTKVTGNGNYYIKLKYTGDDKVQIYVHTSKSLKIKDTITLTTYAPGESITKSKVIDIVEDEGWRYTYFYTYTEESWNKIVEGGSADQTKAFTVESGVTEIHVYLTNGYTSSSSSSSTSDNPKTGDTVLMAVTVLGLSSAALAALYIFNKKKQSM